MFLQFFTFCIVESSATNTAENNNISHICFFPKADSHFRKDDIEVSLIVMSYILQCNKDISKTDKYFLSTYKKDDGFCGLLRYYHGLIENTIKKLENCRNPSNFVQTIAFLRILLSYASLCIDDAKETGNNDGQSTKSNKMPKIGYDTSSTLHSVNTALVRKIYAKWPHPLIMQENRDGLANREAVPHPIATNSTEVEDLLNDEKSVDHIFTMLVNGLQLLDLIYEYDYVRMFKDGRKKSNDIKDTISAFQGYLKYKILALTTIKRCKRIECTSSALVKKKIEHYIAYTNEYKGDDYTIERFVKYLGIIEDHLEDVFLDQKIVATSQAKDPKCLTIVNNCIYNF